jgi:hypothetical protein
MHGGFMAEQNHPTKLPRVPVLLSVVALLVWVGVGAFLVKWIRLWAAGRLEPGINTSWGALYGVFGLAVLALAGGVFLTIRAWQGKSTVGWQVFSVILGAVSLWAVSGD